MGDMQLTAFDAVALAIILISGVMALARGFVREVFSIVAFLAALAAAIYGLPLVQPIARGMINQAPIIADIAAAVFIFLVVFILITVLTATLAKAVHSSSEIGALDRGAGFLFGVARGILILALFVFIFREATPVDRRPDWLTKAKLYPPLETVADWMKAVAPKAGAYLKDKREDLPKIGQ